MAAVATLMVQGGANSGKEITLTERPLTLGRRADNDVMVDHTTVSRRHALVMDTPAGFVLRDLNSTNGTFLNGGKLDATERPLKHGDRIRLAGSDLTFVFRQEGADTQPMKLDSPVTGAIRLPEQPASQPVAKETELLRYLELKKGTAVSREDIARSVWPELPPGAQVNQEIDQAVDRLRSQMEDDPNKPTHVISVGEFGFLLL